MLFFIVWSLPVQLSRGNAPLMFYVVQVSSVYGLIENSNLTVGEPGLCHFFQCGQKPGPAGRWSASPHKLLCWTVKCSKGKCSSGRWLDLCWTKQRIHTSIWHGSPRHHTLEKLLFCTSPVLLQIMGPLLPNIMQDLLSSEKRNIKEQPGVSFL